MLLSVNKTTVTVNLNSWHNGGCPITFFVIQYKSAGHHEWTLVSNNIIPEQQTITITDLTPGAWYSLLMTARNDAGSTDAEYVFATLTLTGAMKISVRASLNSTICLPQSRFGGNFLMFQVAAAYAT
ncbi:down syndrome cell adhesion molecule-like protein Dscam2 [Trichonephila clavipes]|nr:down syndrome cell adhesion molecule-like protein Dscam2 [Trichonephila clavipes]